MNASTWTENALKFIEDIRDCEDADDRFDLIMELGDTLEPLPEELKTESNRVQGCTASVWLVPEFIPGAPRRVRFRTDSDSTMVRGLAALLISQVNDKPCDEVAALDFRRLADEFSLHQYLSPSRSNGLFAMSKRLGRLAAIGIQGDPSGDESAPISPTDTSQTGGSASAEPT
ncbi:MAG: SufE family protein [Planctomycetaceae bacterium]|nr:MAG: SufE family protein [Planctomycetaceae bacterium]